MIFSCLIQKQRTLELTSGMCGSVICRYADTIGRVLHALVKKLKNYFKKEVQKKKRAFLRVRENRLRMSVEF